jgi:adenylate cyclase
MEIEHKFLVKSTDWGVPLSSRYIEQGYVFIGSDRNMRVRRTGDKYIMALKVRTGGIGRHEIEFEIDAPQGQSILDQLCVSQVIRKTRHVVEYRGSTWEIDVFDGANAGLLLAEIELSFEGQAFAKPPWLGPEVTGDERFFNDYLSRYPFEDWQTTYEDLLAEVGGKALAQQRFNLAPE